MKLAYEKEAEYLAQFGRVPSDVLEDENGKYFNQGTLDGFHKMYIPQFTDDEETLTDVLADLTVAIDTLTKAQEKAFADLAQSIAELREVVSTFKK